MQELVDKIKALANQHLKDDSFFIVDILTKGVAGKTKILVLLDGDKGVTIDDCADMSRKLAEEIELEDLVDFAYVLEVSSPGLDHPLASVRQYKKNIDRKLKIKLSSDSIIEGQLKSVSEEEIILATEKKVEKKKVIEERSIPFSEIEKANVLVSFK